MSDITKILEQEFAREGSTVGKAYLLDARDEIERLASEAARWEEAHDYEVKLRGMAADEIARLRENRDYWMTSCQEAQKSRDTASVLLAASEAEVERLRENLKKEQGRFSARLSIRQAEIERLRSALLAIIKTNRDPVTIAREALGELSEGKEG